MSTALIHRPITHIRRFLLLHHNKYAEMGIPLFGHCQGEGALFGNGNVVVEINDATYVYGSLEEMFKVYISSGLLVLKWIDEEDEC